MTTGESTILTKIPGCKICYSTYDLYSHKPFVFQDCGHDLCGECVQNLKNGLKTQNYISCYFCKTKHRIIPCSKQNFSIFKENVKLTSIIQFFQEKYDCDHLGVFEKDFVCLDQKCQNCTYFCLLCKQLCHQNCEEHLLIKKSDFWSKVLLINKFDLSIKVFKENLSENKKNVPEILLRMNENLIAQLAVYEPIAYQADIEKIIKNKNTFEIKFDKINKKIQLIQKVGRYLNQIKDIWFDFLKSANQIHDAPTFYLRLTQKLFNSGFPKGFSSMEKNRLKFIESDVTDFAKCFYEYVGCHLIKNQKNFDQIVTLAKDFGTSDDKLLDLIPAYLTGEVIEDQMERLQFEFPDKKCTDLKKFLSIFASPPKKIDLNEAFLCQIGLAKDTDTSKFKEDFKKSDFYVITANDLWRLGFCDGNYPASNPWGKYLTGYLMSDETFQKLKELFANNPKVNFKRNVMFHSFDFYYRPFAPLINFGSKRIKSENEIATDFIDLNTEIGKLCQKEIKNFNRNYFVTKSIIEKLNEAFREGTEDECRLWKEARFLMTLCGHYYIKNQDIKELESLVKAAPNISETKGLIPKLLRCRCRVMKSKNEANLRGMINEDQMKVLLQHCDKFNSLYFPKSETNSD